MTNRSTGRSPFSIIYTKVPNSVIDLAAIQCTSQAAASLAEQFSEMLAKVRNKLLDSNQAYKQQADRSRREKIFNPGDLVLVRLRKERLPPGDHSKLTHRKFGSFTIMQRINNNAYVIDLPPEFQTSNTFNVTDIYSYTPPNDSDVPMLSGESMLFCGTGE
ncbi:hypothetical protein KFK09_009231 [Dendrobium nobile]|uniref:Tf2-1-like SH3-like domain-containing protein n=1 Tax=Dendrobium nobile TaxID=94219 RepID=A0A8T3BMA5_DENNO|nr:hypothetical protein KFK09_009231 [Dendrobium nobile]